MKRGEMKGRGATLQMEGRFESRIREAFDDGWEDEELPPLKTTVTLEKAKSVIQYHDSPDLPFGQSLNAYRGCEHGCIYCYARPSHAYLDLSPGLDFETRLFAKPDAPELLRKELGRKNYQCEVLAIGTNTDPFQPIEREWKITRRILDLLLECGHPVSIITKSALIERDIDLLSALAEKNLVQVFISVTTLDPELARKMEPRASSPGRRLEAIGRLNDAKIPCGVMVAPVVPYLTDSELEAILHCAHDSGAKWAGYTLLRLPHELKALFSDWLETHYSLKAAHVMNRLREMREGRENDPDFGSRMRGKGIFADLLEKRFLIASRRLGLNREPVVLDKTRFRSPNAQLGLF
ncbi:MAG TPA: PA0069 family radical SAM protein [Burkholderiales bacterium]|nr:PA0069 family radical SAM protein [Burkholderiales bacterium]